VTVILIKVKSCSTLLLMLLVCICSYPYLILRYKFLIFDTIIQTNYVYVSKDVRIHGYFLKPERVRKQNSVGKTVFMSSVQILQFTLIIIYVLQVNFNFFEQYKICVLVDYIKLG
jgi:hypothetical protein